ncbi:hypothetical protein BaRGS_00027987, partial [Batillaria attramentaria]
MKAVRVHEFGGWEVFQYETNVLKPTSIGDTQILMKASAIGINPSDQEIASGNFIFQPKLPWIPGDDAAGVVEAVGKHVTRFKTGDRVYCTGTVSGAYAEYVVSEERQTGHLGSKLTFTQGAALGSPYTTAYRAVIHTAKLRAGETVLIHGASGAAATGGGVDVVIEMATGINLQRDLDVIAMRGRIVLVGAGPETTISPLSVLVKEARILGINMFETTEADWREMTAFFEAGMETGWVRPVVAKEYPLAKVGQALKDMQEKSGSLGNYVMTVIFVLHPIHETMKAVRIHKFGGLEVFQYDTGVPKPSVGDTQVLLKASAVGINPVDWYIASGNFPIKPPLPWIPGWDAAGVVEAVGKKVTKFKKGDRVYCAGSVSGSYAEYVVSEERQTGHLGKLSFAQGAAIGVPYNTAYRAVVHKAKVRAGETVLIHGASGAVGNAGVQLCKALGARVFGTAGTDKGLDLVKANGAVATFNHREKGYEDKIKAASDGGVDVVIEMAGNVNLQRDLDLVAKRGRIVIVGGVGDITINAGSFLMSETTVQGITLYEAGEADWREMTAFYEAGIETGWVKPVVAKEYPLAQ